MNTKPNKHFLLWMAVVLGSMCLSGINAYGEGAGQKNERQAQWEQKMEKIYAQLGLSEEQKVQLRANKEKHRAAAKALREQIRPKRQHLQEELRKEQVDVNKVRQINEELKSLMNQKADHRLSGILEARSILTAGQYNKFVELKKELNGRHKQGWKERLGGFWRKIKGE